MVKDQMEMSFGQAETKDPVSGNDVPPGSLPEEVRDDIPALYLKVSTLYLQMLYVTTV